MTEIQERKRKEMDEKETETIKQKIKIQNDAVKERNTEGKEEHR